jgi:YHS domain-containing protein
VLVKCKICGKQIDRDTCFKRIVNGKNWYCHSEEEYNDWDAERKKKQDDKDRVYNIITEIFGYEIQNSILFKEWTSWNVLKSDEIIAKYLDENIDYLTKAIARLISSEYAKIRYFSTILKNNLHDFKPKVIEEPVKIHVDETIYNITNISPVNKRRSLADLEDEVD